MAKTALIVDDSRSMRVVASKVLSALEFEILEAEDGEQGLSILDEHPECVVALVDWRMEGMDGYEFVTKVRADERFTDLKLVMVTVENAKDKVLQAAHAGIDGYILKPYDKQELTQRLQDLGVVDG